VREAIDRRGSGAQLDAALKSRMDEAQSKYDVWGIGDCPDGLTAKGDAAEALRSIDRFSFGAALHEGLELTAELHARSTGDAAKMTAALSILEAALKAQQPKDSGTKFDLHSEDGSFRISLAMSDEDLRKAIATQQTWVTSAASNRTEGDPAPVAAPEAALPAVAGPATLPVLEAMTPPAPSIIVPEAVQPVPVAPKPAVKPKNQAEIIKAPNGDTMFVKLPGGK
jgi:hypothetical protein